MILFHGCLGHKSGKNIQFHALLALSASTKLEFEVKNVT